MTDRKCYCSLREKDPNYYSKQGIPDGFCALCSVCNKPGHACHVPAALPYTGGWCDEHYELIKSAFLPNFAQDKIKVYFQTVDNSKKNLCYLEVVGEMLFRAVLKKDDKLIRYKHGSLKFEIVAWITPVTAWKIPPVERISEDKFTQLWQEAVDPV